ncbi:nicotinate-nucleotide adenylyltransferase [uncultured Desulfuromusa sp.]|uniref:nicotinate-nucleotide adenylyltransferase n=1 Tax=uncultured Desulfuromusa sp. TaxID=219183 RepID=UPI002AA93E43|nr:nicotinate-nucleotide adenylyltransferase [uncultured Desulfuromusa sp.]
MRIGLLGGTFNPIHSGHLHIAEEVQKSCHLDQVLFIPTCRPPHKDLAADIPFDQRLEMVDIALADYPCFFSCDIEGRRGGHSYSVETLQQLHAEHPQDEYFFIMGMDSFQELSLWKDYARLFDFAHIVVTARPGFAGTIQELLPVAIAGRFCYDSDSQNLQCETGFSLITVAHTCRDISSTDIRQKMAEGHDVGGQVPRAVIEYIKTHHLYS